MSHEWNEADYRKKIQETLQQIERPFETIDPDVAECEQAHGSMMILLKDKSRCILSAQPSVRQLWLAVAAKGIAFHFNYDFQKQQWIDDKGKGIELLSYLSGLLTEAAGTPIRF